MTTQNLTQNSFTDKNQIILVCATRSLCGAVTGLVVPIGKVGKVLEFSPEGRLFIDFGLPTVHLLSPTDNRIAILATREVTQ